MDADAWVSLASGLVGTIVGAATSWFVTKSSVEREHQNQKELVHEQEVRDNITALRSIILEIEHNLVCLDSTERSMNELKADFINLKEKGITTPIKNNKWEKHSDTIEGLLTPKQLNVVVNFYLNLSLELHNQAFTRKRLELLKKTGLESIEILKQVEA